MISIGKFDERVEIKARVMTKNEFGEEVLTFQTLDTVWASVVPTSGNERFLAAAFYAEAQLKIRMRYRNDFDETAQIIWDDKTWYIIHIADYRRTGERMLLVKKV